MQRWLKMATQFERYINRDKKSYNTKSDSKSSKDTSGLDKDLKKYVESGVYSSSFAKKQQDSRKKDDKKKSSSSRSSRSSRSSNSSSSSLPKDSVFNKQLNEQPQSKAPTQEESEEASKRGVTVADLRDTTKTSSVRSRGDDRLQKDMSSVFKPQERPQS